MRRNNSFANGRFFQKKNVHSCRHFAIWNAYLLFHILPMIKYHGEKWKKCSCGSLHWLNNLTERVYSWTKCPFDFEILEIRACFTKVKGHILQGDVIMFTLYCTKFWMDFDILITMKVSNPWMNGNQ